MAKTTKQRLKDVRTTIILPGELHRLLKDLSVSERRSFNQQVVHQLENSVKLATLPPTPGPR